MYSTCFEAFASINSPAGTKNVVISGNLRRLSYMCREHNAGRCIYTALALTLGLQVFS